MKKQKGIALLPVAIIITVIAAVSLLMSYETSMNVNETAAQSEAKKADLIAEAGMAHAKWQLQQNTSCTGYSNISSTNFGTHSYTANVNPTSGSPITLSANGISSFGVARTLVDAQMEMYQTPFTKEYILDATGQDSFIEGESGHTDHNKGSDQYIKIKSQTNKEKRGFLQFDLSNIPANSKIMDATLELYMDVGNGGSTEISIHRITDDWVVDEVTWEIKRSGFFQNWSPQGGEYAATISGTFTADNQFGWKNVEIKQLVQDWVKAPSINQGMVLIAAPNATNNEKTFISSDHTDSTKHPKLTITYACECGQQCLNPALSKLLFVVNDPKNIDPQELARQSLIESWGYTVTLIDDSDSQGDFDTATLVHDVVYVSEEIDHNQLRDKLRNVPIGVVNEEQYLFQEFGFSNARSLKIREQIDVVNNSHYITSVFPTGLLTVYTSEQPSSMVITPATGVQTLGLLNNSGPSWEPSLAVIEVGGALFGGGVAAARRVKLPWAYIDMSTLNDNGQTITRRAIEWASGVGDVEVISSLIAHWKLDETTGFIATESTNSFDGVLENNPEWEASGRIEGALLFDNVNAQIVVPHSDQLSPTNAITMSAWVFNDSASLSDSYRIISKETFGDNDNFFLSVQNRWLWMGIGGSFFSPGINLSSNQWYHVVGTFDDDANEVRMYVDGVEVLSQNTTATLSGNKDSIYIGSNWEEFKWWEGLLDDVRLYNRALMAEEIEELFKSAPAEGGGGSKLPPDPPTDLCAGNFLDEFNQREYSGNDGTLKWSTDWIEINESNGPTSGDEQVRSDLGHDYVLRIRDNDGGGEGVQRQADLSVHTTATLKFLYSRDSLDNSSDYVTVEASKDGADWNEVERISGPGTDDTYLPLETDISSFISPLTSIRFLTSSTLGGTDTVYIDNVEIEVSGCAK